MDKNTVDAIDAATRSAETLSGLGIDGFVLFVVAIAAVMFGGMMFVAYKSQKTLIETLTDKHNENAEDIDAAHKRIREIESREDECIRRLDLATTKLDSCAGRLETCFETLRNSK